MDEDSIYYSIYEYAKLKHAGQKRKNGVEDYINHPFRVSQIVRMNGGTIEQQAASLLHDVVEDCQTTLEELRQDISVIVLNFGGYKSIVDTIVKYVDDLTIKFTPQAYPHLNRKKRRAAELEHFIVNADPNSKIIKLADIADNLSSIEGLDPGFAPKYLSECLKIMEAIKIDHPIYKLATKAFQDACEKIKK